MRRVLRAVIASAAVGTLATTGLVATGPVGAAVEPRAGSSVPTMSPAETDLAAIDAGLQVGPKHDQRPTVRWDGRTYAAPNPYLAQLPSSTDTDWSYWRQRVAAQGLQRQRARRAREVPTPTTHVEEEPAALSGGNDSRADSERLDTVNPRREFQAARVLGTLARDRTPTGRLSTREDQGSIPRATRTGIGPDLQGVLVRSRIGDGRHGRAREGDGDFDFFKVTATKGQTISATTAGSRFDTVLVVYDRGGRIKAANDDVEDGSGFSLTSKLDYQVRRSGSYYVMVSGFGRSVIPRNPFRPDSGRGAGDEGAYTLRIRAGHPDEDFYGLYLRSGDVISGTVSGAAQEIGVSRSDGRAMIGSRFDISGIYPESTPLPGGGASMSYVADRPGWYAVSARRGTGDYRMLVETYRPGPEQAPDGTTQTVFLDFDGERLNTAPLYGPGVSTLSPLSAFMARWGLSATQERDLVDAVVASVRESLDETLASESSNPSVRVRVLNSLDDPDPWGQPNVSRVVVGGTIEQSGIPTIGIAQSIDVGNFDREETALVLLDLLSSKAGPSYSLNSYLTRRSDRVAFVGQALGNVVSHEVGHLVGSFHTDNRSDRVNLMDSGGWGFRNLFGVGRDKVGGTTDDRDVDFGEDRLYPPEGLTGLEDTLNTSAWGFSRGTAAP